MPEYVPPVGDEPGVWIFWRKCNHQRQVRTKGNRLWFCIDCRTHIDGEAGRG